MYWPGRRSPAHERERCVWRRVYMRIGECGCMPWWMFTSSVPGLHFRCILHRLFKCRGGMLTPFTAQPILLSHYINLKYTRILIALQVPMCRRVCACVCVCVSTVPFKSVFVYEPAFIRGKSQSSAHFCVQLHLCACARVWWAFALWVMFTNLSGQQIAKMHH